MEWNYFTLSFGTVDMSGPLSLLLSLVLLGSTLAAVFQHEVHHRENMKAKLARQSIV